MVSVLNHEEFFLGQNFVVSLTELNHFRVLILESLLHNLLFFFLSPAYICSPERDAVRNEYKENYDVKQQPEVKHECLIPTSITFKENDLRPAHKTNQYQVEDSKGPAQFPYKTSAMYVVHQEQHEDCDLATKSDVNAVHQIRACTGFRLNYRDESRNATANQ